MPITEVPRVSNDRPESGLAAELATMAARAPAHIAARIAASVDEIAASGTAPGLMVGDPAPDFALPNHLGQRVELSQRLKAGPVVLAFYRGEWCPYCNVSIRALQAAMPRFGAYAASVMAINPQSPDHSLSMVEKNSLAFDVLSDVDQTVIRRYGLHYAVPSDMKELYLSQFQNDLSRRTADGSWNLPIPATFVIDQAGVVRARHVSADYRTRMDPDDIEAALRVMSNLSAGHKG
jgi:peroxiredoxin